MTVGQGAAPAGGADVWLARYIPHAVEVTIPRGENAGHTLPYTDVVREMVLLANGGAKRRLSRRPAATRLLPRLCSCRGAGQGRSSRRRNGKGPHIHLSVIPAKAGIHASAKSGCPLSRA